MYIKMVRKFFAKKLAFRSSLAGFSLLELMIVVALMAIIIAIALPNYKQHINKGQRQQAIADLLQLQLLQERYHHKHNHYATAEELKKLPTSPHYVLTVSGVSVETYTLTATFNDRRKTCAVLTINQANLRQPKDCW